MIHADGQINLSFIVFILCTLYKEHTAVSCQGIKVTIKTVPSKLVFNKTI